MVKRLGRWLITALVLTAGVAGLQACGGGGGGGGGGDDGGSPPPPPVAQVASKSVSGRVDGAGAAAARAAVVQNAVITITSFDVAGVQIDRATASSGTTGFFTAQVEQANDGGYLLMDVIKDGFTDARKRVDFAAPQNVTANATLRPLTTVVVPVDANGAVLSRATGATVPGFTFAVVRSAGGARRVVAGRAALQAAKAADAVTELEINIPAASTGLDGVDTLVGRLESFDPNDAGDAQAFPGDYLDSDGNRLLSVAFDYVAISDENGENLGSLAQTAARAAGKAAVAETRITRYIPTSSCGSLALGDADEATEGFQVPVYTYIPPQGVWGLLGTGTVVADDGSGTGTFANVANVTSGDCQSSGYYLDILVSNEEFIRSWWNLDYPLVFDEPVQVCIEKTFVTDAGAPVESLYVSLDDDDSGESFAYAYGYTNAQGKATISALLLDSTDTDRTATLSYWNPYSYAYVSETVTLGDAPNCTTRTNTLTAPDFCTVRGTVVDAAGAGQPDEYLWIYGSGASTYYTYAYTDAAGDFEAEVYCDEDMELYLGGDYTADAVFNVSGSTADHADYEASDDGAAVVLVDVIAENQPPEAWAYLSSYNVRTTGTAMVYLYAWDYEGDYPITYTVKTNGTAKATGTISDSDGSYAEIPLSGLAEGTYAVSVDVADGLGATASAVAGTLSVTAAGSNRLPIVYAYADPTRVSAAGEVLTFWAYGWDLDGDLITYSWTVNGAAAGEGDTVEYTVPAGATEGDSYVVEVTAFDGLGSSTASFTLYFGTPTQVDVIVQ